MNNIIVPWKEWNLVEIIGLGQYSAVYKLSRMNNGTTEYAAMKVLTMTNQFNDNWESSAIDFLNDVKKQHSTLIRLSNHPNIVRCYDIEVIQNEDGNGFCIYILMEYLKQVIMPDGMCLPEDTVTKLGCDICNALRTAESQGLMHGNIKPTNIFVDRFGCYKLGDFGITPYLSELYSRVANSGSNDFLAPETYKSNMYDGITDMYSLGLVLYYYLDHKIPFISGNQTPSFQAILNAREQRINGMVIPSPVNGSDKIKNIILRACAYNRYIRYQNAGEMLSDLLVAGDGTVSDNLYKNSYITPKQSGINDNHSNTFPQTANSWSDSTETVGIMFKSGQAQPLGPLSSKIDSTETVGKYYGKNDVIPSTSESSISMESVGVNTRIKPDPYVHNIEVKSKPGHKPKLASEKNKGRKKRIVIVIILVIFVALLLCFILFRNKGKSNSSVKIGDVYLMGDYHGPIEWLVVDVRKSAVLLLSTNVIDYFEYDDNSNDWNNSTICRWLNTDFLTESFSESEASIIDNTDGGKIFLLNAEEADKYLKANGNRAVSPTEYAVSQGIKTDGDGYCSWWLRSKGNQSDYAAYVYSYGHIVEFGQSVTNKSGIRPAMWVNLE